MLNAFAQPSPAVRSVRSLETAPPAYEMLIRAIERLEEVVEAETAALRKRASIDLKEFNNRKSQGLLDLSKALRSFPNAQGDPLIVNLLVPLRAKLDDNCAVLKMHLDAVREISSVVAEVIRDSESDGTYTASIGMAYSSA
jgi:hypothetical protein